MTNSNSALQKISVAKAALEKARTIPEVKVIRDQAAALSNYLKQQNYCLTIQNDAGELKLRAERKLGNIIPDQFPQGRKRFRAGTLKESHISKTDSHRWQQVAAIPEPDFDAFVEETKARSKELTTSAAVEFSRQIASTARRADLTDAEAKAVAGSRKSLSDRCTLEVSDLIDFLPKQRGIEAIITDPPYPKKFLHLYGQLAKLASEASVPVVAVMCGQSYLPQILADMTPHLEYRWTLCYHTPGPATRLWDRRLESNWKPILLFGGAKFLNDFLASEAPDKEHHDWGQSISGTLELVKRLTNPNQLVCDPFLGGGATALAAISAGRRFCGCDTDPAAIQQTSKRLHEFCQTSP